MEHDPVHICGDIDCPVQGKKLRETSVGLDLQGSIAPAKSTGDRAAELLVQIAGVLKEKAAYYGDSISRSPVLAPGMDTETACLVRASDKIARMTGGSGDTTDAVVDLIGYLALLLAIRGVELD